MNYRKLRIAWSVGWGVLAVLLCVCFVSCREQSTPIPDGWVPGPRDVDWNESLAETVPSIGDIASIQYNSIYVGQSFAIPPNDWPVLISVFNESVPGASGTTIPVIGWVEITKGDGQLVRVWIYDAGERAVVYHFNAPGDERSDREYYSARGKQRIAAAFPAIRMAGTVEPQTSYSWYYWVLGVAVLLMGGAIWSRSRFSLRTLLIAITAVAIGLGLIAWLQ